jgi:hypothetical protein
VVADAVVDWGALLEVVWTSLVGGIGVTAIFALAILGGTRAIDMRDAGNPAAAGVYGALTALALAAVAVAVVLGILVMTQK